MEVKIGIQHAPRELVVDTDETADAVEKMVADAVGSEGVLALTDSKGRKVIVPAATHRLRRDRRRRWPARSASGAERPAGGRTWSRRFSGR